MRPRSKKTAPPYTTTLDPSGVTTTFDGLPSSLGTRETQRRSPVAASNAIVVKVSPPSHEPLHEVCPATKTTDSSGLSVSLVPLPSSPSRLGVQLLTHLRSPVAASYASATMDVDVASRFLPPETKTVRPSALTTTWLPEAGCPSP